jgi:uncharacterized membrane protein YedE/YeeE
MQKGAFEGAAAALCGWLFSSGLLASGMCNPAKVLGFLTAPLSAAWDPDLAFVMGGAVLVTGVAFSLAAKVLKRSLSGNELEVCKIR